MKGKLSETQREVLRLMSEGWELGSTEGIDSRWWLQEGGIAKGGKTKEVRASTFFSLLDKGLVEAASRKFPFTYYRLTEKGKSNL